MLRVVSGSSPGRHRALFHRARGCCSCDAMSRRREGIWSRSSRTHGHRPRVGARGDLCFLPFLFTFLWSPSAVTATSCVVVIYNYVKGSRFSFSGATTRAHLAWGLTGSVRQTARNRLKIGARREGTVSDDILETRRPNRTGGWNPASICLGARRGGNPKNPTTLPSAINLSARLDP